MDILRHQEIDALAEARLLPGEELFNAELRNGFRFDYPEVLVEIRTGLEYPVTPLTYDVTNISLPRVVVDQLRTIFREVVERDRFSNSLKRWFQRLSIPSGCFEFEMTALHLAEKTAEYLKSFRSNPTY